MSAEALRWVKAVTNSVPGSFRAGMGGWRPRAPALSPHPPTLPRAPVRGGGYPAARGTTSSATWSITSRTPEAVGWKTSQMISVTPAAA